MPTNRRVGTGEEPVEFRPLPGQEEDWAEFNYLDQTLWFWMGIFPIAVAHMLILVMIGLVAG